MLPSTRPARRAIVGSLGAGALAAAILFGSAGTAAAEPTPEPLVPPPCSAAELARVMSGVSFDTSNYLITHPEVNDFFTGLKGETSDQIEVNTQDYLDANPAVRDDIHRLRQPAADFRQRCGLPEPTH